MKTELEDLQRLKQKVSERVSASTAEFKESGKQFSEGKLVAYTNVLAMIERSLYELESKVKS